MRAFGGQVEILELPQPDRLEAGEVLIEVRAAGVGNWDDIARNGDWALGIEPPMALGVEASGVVRAVGRSDGRLHVGDEVLTHPLPLLNQGTWAPLLVAAETTVARKPRTMTWESAAVFPVPALTAGQLIANALQLREWEWVLINGAGGVTGGMLVALAAASGAHVIAVAASRDAERLRSYGAEVVLDYHDSDWRAKARGIFGAGGAPAVVNAVRGGSHELISLVADGGRLATTTGDAPPSERGVSVTNFYVSPDAEGLGRLANEFAERRLLVPVAATYELKDAATALALVAGGHAGGGVVLLPGT